MHITLNGETRQLDSPPTITELLREIQIDGRVAVEINREILPRSCFDHHRLDDGDVVEIVRAIGGG